MAGAHLRPNLPEPDPEPSALEAVTDAVLTGLADTPWWATLIIGLIVLALGAAALVWALRTTGRLALTARQSLTEAATRDPDRRARAGVWLRQRAQTLLFVVVVAIVVGLSAQTLVGWLVSVGMSPGWARLAFVAFDGMAVLLALTLWRRVERGERAGLLRLAVWGIVGATAWLNSHHAPAGEPAAAVAYAAFPILAAIGLEVLLQEQRRDRSFLRRQSGEEANRRMAAVRWLHPVERIRVALMLATDERIGSDQATREVRIQSAAVALWRLRRAEALTGHLRWIVRTGPVERRAQRALARCGAASDPTVLPDVLRRVQVLTQAGRIAGLDYGSDADARAVARSLITAEAFEEPTELEIIPEQPAADRTEPWTEQDAPLSDPVGTEPDPAPAELEDGSGRWKVKELKPAEPSPIRSVDGQSGPHRSMDELKAEMTKAVRTGQLDRNTVDAIVDAVRTGKPRARKLREWAKETSLFERFAPESEVPRKDVR